MTPREHVDAPPTTDDLTRILARPSAMAIFAAIIFVAGGMQVAANPFVALLQGATGWDHPLPLVAVTALALGGLAVQCACLLVSPRLPVGAAAGAAACYLGCVVWLSVPNWLTPMPFVVGIAVFLMAAHRRPVVSFSVAGVIVGVTALGLIAWALSTGAPFAVVSGFVLETTLSFAAPVVGGTALGVWWSRRVERLRRARDELAAAARQQEEHVRRARAQERARIAQELHDVAGQHLAGLMSLADAAVDIDIVETTQAVGLIEDIRTEGRFATASLYAALRDLRAENDATAEPTPDLHDVSDLVAYWGARGLDVGVTQTGLLDDLPAMVSTTAYRVAQEALTNVGKHAPGATVEVEVTVTDAVVRVTVRNSPGRDPRAATPAPGLGWGLRALGERVELLRGTFAAGPTAAGGWAVFMEAPVADVDAHAVPSP